MNTPNPKPKASPKSSTPVTVEELLQQTPNPTREQVKAISEQATVKGSAARDPFADMTDPGDTFDATAELDRLTNENNALKRRVAELDELTLQFQVEISRLTSEGSALTRELDKVNGELKSARYDFHAMKKGFEGASANVATLTAELDRVNGIRKALRVALAAL